MVRKLLYIISMLLIHSWILSQNTLDQKLSLDFEHVTLRHALNEIAKSADLQFSYSASTIDDHVRVDKVYMNVPVSEMLTDLLSNVGGTYVQIDEYIILKKAHKNEQENIELIEQKEPHYYTISGYVEDEENEEVLIGAVIHDPVSMKATTTNNHGFFSLTLPEGNYNLELSFLGYQVKQTPIELNSNVKLNLKMLIQSLEMQEVIIVENKDEIIQNANGGLHHMSGDYSRSKTSAIGGSDIIKSLNDLPGISLQNDGSSYFHVRGGGRDQNLILLDDATIFNPFHLLGLLTPIIPDAVKSTNVYMGDFPVEYGGRLSSIVDVRTRNGNLEKFNANSTIGILTSKFSVEGPFEKNKSSYFLTYRTFNYPKAIERQGFDDFGFYDITGKINFKIGQKDRIYLTGYNSSDSFLQPMAGVEWTNLSFTSRWNHIWTDKLFSNTTLYHSSYLYTYNYDRINEFFWESEITNTSLKSDWTYFIDPTNELEFGIKLADYDFIPGNHSENARTFDNQASLIRARELMTYIGNKITLADKMILSYGFRMTRWSNYGPARVLKVESEIEEDKWIEYEDNREFYVNTKVEPRVSVSYDLGEKSSVKGSYNRTLQNIHLLNSSISPFNSIEVWLPSGRNIDPQHADIFNLGYLKYLEKIDVQFHVDLYYKLMFNVIAFDPHLPVINPEIESGVHQGDGIAYGAELTLSKEVGKWQGKVSYAFNRSVLDIPSLYPESFFTRQDKPLDFNFEMIYHHGSRWKFNANFILNSGNRFSAPVSFYEYRGKMVPQYGKPYNDRLPTYKRVDIGMEYRLNKKTSGRFTQYLRASLFNVFAFKNPAYINFNQTRVSDDQFLVPTDVLDEQSRVATQWYLFTIFPSLSYEINFK